MSHVVIENSLSGISNAVSEPTKFSVLAIRGPKPVAEVNKEGHVFVYSKDGLRYYTGVVMDLPLPDGQLAVYEVLRALGLRCSPP